MASLLSNNKEDRKVTHSTFLATLNKKEKNGKKQYPNGILVGVEKVYGPRDSTDYNGKPQTQLTVILSIIDDLEHGIVGRKLDKEGKVLKEPDEFGKNKTVFTTYEDGEDGTDTVPFYFKVSKSNEDKIEDGEDCDIRVYPMSACFSLFNEALKQYGTLDNPNNQAFECNTSEIKEALEGLEFYAQCELSEFSGNSYFKLVCTNIQE